MGFAFSHRVTDLSGTQEFDDSQLPEDSEVQEEECDPLYPHLGYTPSEAFYAFHETQVTAQLDSESDGQSRWGLFLST